MHTRNRFLLALFSLVLAVSLALGSSAGGSLANTLAAPPRADFNSDHYADLAVGVPSMDFVGAANGGGLYTLYGTSPAGLSSADSQLWTQFTDPLETTDHFAEALAAGDFNGDGFIDLAVGVPNEDVDGNSNAGAINIFYGRSSGLSSIDGQFWHQGVGDIQSIIEADDDFGSVLAAGDFDGDGYTDLAVGVPYEDWEIGQSNCGIVQTLYGSASGLTDAGNQLFRQGADGIPKTGEDDDQFGAALATGDFDGNGYDDLAIGVPGEDFESLPANNVGVVHVLYGAADGLTTAENDLWHQDVLHVENLAEAFDTFGAALASGDFNGDGYDELAIGVRGESVGSEAYAGAVQILFGDSTGLTPLNDQLWDQDDLVGTAAEAGDHFGYVLATGDFNGDSYDDLAVSAPDEDYLTITDTGCVHVMYGSSSGLSTISNMWFLQGVGGLGYTSEESDQFGESLAASDFNGDGFTDLAVGVPHEDVLLVVDAGGVGIIYGSDAGLASAGNQFWNQASNGIDGDPEELGHFGGALAAIPFASLDVRIYLPIVQRNGD